MVGVTSECAWEQWVNEGQTKSRRHKSVTCVLVPTAHNEVNRFISIEGIFLVHDAQGGETPVDCIQAQMSSHMIDKIVFVLFSPRSKISQEIKIYLWQTDISQRLDVSHMSVHEQSRSHRQPSVCCVVAPRAKGQE